MSREFKILERLGHGDDVPKPRTFCQELAEYVKSLVSKKNIVRISAIHLFGSSYRVNVWRSFKCEKNLYDIEKISESFHVVLNEDASVKKSDPPLFKSLI